ncbi:MAG: endonuclease/exonuclease/phosphatase family protein [Boseongicola sp.]
MVSAPTLAESFRIGVYHTELSRDGPGLLLRDIQSGKDPQVLATLNVLRNADADILVLAGFDFDAGLVALNAYADQLVSYPYRFALRPNRGLPTGADVDGDGKLGGPADAHGYARFSGQSGLAVLSRFQIETDKSQDFSALLWRELPGHNLPAGVFADLRLSTTAHWRVPVRLPNGHLLDLLTWHATPPVFDGPEDRNGWRNHDETAFWLGFLDDESAKSPNNLPAIAGFANLDPIDGDGRPEALRALLNYPGLIDPKPKSEGAVRATAIDGGANVDHRGNPALDTVDWADGPKGPGNLRVSYILPSTAFAVVASGVLWPDPGAPLGRDVNQASRHRLVWVDLELTD